MKTAKTNRKPILVLDFDGVIHSYKSGWKGARVIPDEPVPGCIEFLLESMNEFEVAILSSRSHQFGGRRAMKKYLKGILSYFLYHLNYEDLGKWQEITGYDFGIDPWDDEVEYWARSIIKNIKWPIFKPAAMVTIDDRAVTFNGQWPDLPQLKSFKPWNKK